MGSGRNRLRRIRLPEGERSIDFAGRLLDDTGVVVTPGIGYGARGEGYVRLSLTTPDDRIDEGLRHAPTVALVSARPQASVISVRTTPARWWRASTWTTVPSGA